VTGSASWNSTNPAVATVNNTTPKCPVTGVAGGTAFIIATYTGSKYTWQVTYCLTSSVTYSASATCTVCNLTITNPVNGQVFSLGGANYNTTTTPLTASSACSGTANWALNFSYTRQSGAVTYTSTANTTSTIGQTNNYVPPTGNGGQINLTAQATLAGHSFSPSSLAYIDGTAIPSANITSRLVGLYSTGATPHLLTGIAKRESNFQQFVQRSLYVIWGLWPNDSYDGGSHVGLMQVPNSMFDAFDWMTNTYDGYLIFQGKLAAAGRYVASQRASYPTLPDMTPTQYEDDALVIYGPFGSGGYYWVANSAYAGWVINPNNPNGVSYADDVRSKMQ
jgi:hypothetical protein